MAKVIKYSTSAVDNTLKTGNMVLGANTVDYGTSFYTTVEPPAGGYTIYSNKASGGPSINVAADDTELIWYANSFGAGGVETIGAALAWFNTQADKTVISSTDKFTDIVSDGLVVHLDATSTISYPGTGTAWYDLSGNGYNATLTNGPTFNSSSKASIVYDGVNDWVYIPGQTAFNSLVNNFTVTGWINPSSAGYGFNGQRLFGLGYVAQWQLELRNDNGRRLAINYRQNSTNYFQANGPSITQDKWNHVGFVIDNGVVQYILNGQTYSGFTIAQDFVASGQPFSVGNYNGASDGAYNGKISSCQLYNRVLTDSEIKQNYYNSITPNILFNTSCSAWYDCSLPYSTTDRDGFNTVDTTDTVTLSRLYDLSGNSRHGVQTTKSKQPTLGSLNRKTVIEALTSGKAIQLPNGIGGNPFTYFILAKHTGGNTLFSCGRGGESSGFELRGNHFIGYSNQFNFAPYNRQVYCALPTPAAYSQYQLLILNCYPTYTEATVSIMGGNVEPSMVTLKNNYAGNNSLDYVISCNVQNGFFCRNLGYPSGTTDSYGTGAVAEFVGVQKNCTAAEIAAMQNYFYNKWFK